MQERGAKSSNFRGYWEEHFPPVKGKVSSPFTSMRSVPGAEWWRTKCSHFFYVLFLKQPGSATPGTLSLKCFVLVIGPFQTWLTSYAYRWSPFSCTISIHFMVPMQGTEWPAFFLLESS
jgi:hypothetical protein